MAGSDLDKPSVYLNYLPAIFHGDTDKSPFVGRYLKIFEKLLSGIDDGVKDDPLLEEQRPGIEQILDRIHGFFIPETTPQGEFLSWLANWTALVLREDWQDANRRRLLRRIIPLYRMRGTKKGLEEYLKIYVSGGDVEITEISATLQIGVASTIGRDTYLGGEVPHFFQVTVTLPEPNLEMIQLRERTVRAIIDLEKPAHTYYHLKTIIPTFQIGTYSTIGVDTLLANGT